MLCVDATTIRSAALAALVIAGGCAGVASAQEAMEARVKASKVNLRARPAMSSEVVTQAELDERLRVVSERENWIEVAAPDRSEAWVHGDFVRDGASTTDDLNVRAGAGINYSVIGMFARGQPVAVRGQFGDWLKVAPSTCTVWINRNMVDLVVPQKLAESAPAPVLEILSPAPALLPPAAAAPQPADASPAPPPPAPAAASAEPPPVIQPSLDLMAPAPPDLKLVPLEGQGRVVQREGELKQAPFVFGRPSKFRLCRREGTQFATICYVRGNTGQLTSLLHERLIIRGREYWVQGMKHPVVVLERIEKPVN